MTPQVRRSFAAAASAALLTLTMAGVIPSIAAQDAGSSKTKSSKAKAKAPAEVEPSVPLGASAKSARKAPDPMRRVPTYFGSLGLTAEQKEEIYAIQGRYIPQIQELQAKIESLRERAMADCEDVLTPAQRKILVEARKTAIDRRKAASKTKAGAAIDE